MKISHLLLLAAVSLLLVANQASSQEESTVVSICVVCHGIDGSAPDFEDVPIIAGTPASHIEEAIYSYQDGARRCIDVPAMCEVVFQLTEEEVAEAADHFAAQKRVTSGEPFSDRLAMKGRNLHRQHCISCHARPDEDRAEDALGIPLHGQRSSYLRYAIESYFNGNRDTLIPEMETKMRLLTPDDIEALINYYASYSP
jgi:cytochrome c553